MMQGGAVTSQLSGIPSGSAGVRKTLEIMRTLAEKGATQIEIRLKAMDLVKGIPSRNWSAEASALLSFVQRQIRYLRDPLGVELIQDPIRTLQLQQGDCDDKSILLASLLLSIGHPARFHAVGINPGTYSHVYVETQIDKGGKWIAAETTLHKPLGWEPKGAQHMTLELRAKA